MSVSVISRFMLLAFHALAIDAVADSFAARFIEKEVIDFAAARGMGTGVSATDYDGDGDIDLYLPTGIGHVSRLLRNAGDGSFAEVQLEVGLDSVSSVRAALWIDANGDGQLDLLAAGDSWGIPDGQGTKGEALRLYQQHDGQFLEVTGDTGIDSRWITQSRAHLGGLCAGDVNNDGYVDIMVSLWGGSGSRLFLNNRNGTFAEIAQLSELQSPANSWQPIMCDFDRDGWTDIYAAIDFAPNALWINQRNLKFVDRGFASGSDNHMNDMGITLGDYDNDGDVDLFVTNIERPATRSVLLRNESVSEKLRFAEVAHESGVKHSGWAWGCTFFDADNDGWLDLALTNGWSNREEYLPDQSRLYRNAAGRFQDVSEGANFSDSLWGSSLIAVDIDGDGDRDLLQTCLANDSTTGHLRILENLLDAGDRENVFTVIPRMAGANRFAIGAIVEVCLSSGLKLMRRISAGSSFLGQEPYRATFGIGEATVQSVSVLWPNGMYTELGPQRKGATISPRNRFPDRFLDIHLNSDGQTASVVWHGGALEEGEAGSDGIDWSPVPVRSNPFQVPTEESQKFFRVSSD